MPVRYKARASRDADDDPAPNLNTGRPRGNLTMVPVGSNDP